MWYVIQTITGMEKELVEIIDKVLAGDGYKQCFVIQRECVWRIEGLYCVHIEPLFPSYVFVETSSPERFFFSLKRVPKLTKLLGDDGVFWEVKEEEKRLLQKLINQDDEYIIRRSYVQVDTEGNICFAEGVLKDFTENIVKKRLRKRIVVVEIPFLGEKRRIQLGICLNEDMENGRIWKS